jgi:subfamily B ATP-binding cassette protein MsbA
MSLSFFDSNPSAMLMFRITNDVGAMARISSEYIADFFRCVFTIITLVGLIFYHDWRLASLYISVIPVIVFPIRKIGKRLKKLSHKYQEKFADLNVILQETFLGNKIVKAFGMEHYEGKRFGGENNRLYNLQMKKVVSDQLQSPLMELAGVVGISLVIWYGGKRVIGENMTTGTFFSFIGAVAMLYDPIRKLAKMYNKFQEALAATERVFSMMDVRPEIQDKPDALIAPLLQDSLKFNNVWFRYDSTDMVLKDITLTVPKGKTIALVGLSGAGKSTLVDLIPRFYDISKGRITLDGVDIRDLTINSLRSQIGIVTQETILFNDTVTNNIAYGRQDASQEEIIEAAKMAYAHDFITQLPNSYDTVIGERGDKISGGQRQRLTIARALLKDPKILILDEATSDLDAESEVAVQKALENLMRDRTTLVIAHRLSTVRGADKIVVIDSGQIVEQGRHDELLVHGGVYKRLYELQFKDQETPGRR